MSVRASDDERRRTVAALCEHHLAGRIDLGELESRVATAEQAVTRAALAELLRDLPAEVAVPDAVTEGVPRLPGNRDFTERKVLDEPVGEVDGRILDVVAPQLDRVGYVLEEHEAGAYLFVHAYRPAWAWWVAVLVFPLGLLALWERYEDRITIRIRPVGEDRTALLVHGRAPLAVRRAFATIDR